MGYTHYWGFKGPCTLQARMKFAIDVLAILERSSVKVFYESDVASPPVIHDNLVRFNGEGESGCETFYFVPGERAFCKTNQRPYDVVVAACLLAAKSQFGDSISLTSDGGWPDWAEGRDLFRLATGRVDEFVESPWDREDRP